MVRPENKERRSPHEGSRAGLMLSDRPKPGSTSSAQLELLLALIDRRLGPSPPSKADAERALEAGVGRLMLLEARLREQGRHASGTWPAEGTGDDHGLVEEIRALRDAITELRTRTNAGELAPLAHGFVIPRGTGHTAGTRWANAFRGLR